MSKDSIDIVIQNEQVARQRILYACDVLRKTLPGGPVLLTLGREKRTLSQNAKMWPMLKDVNDQVDWYGFDMIEEDWKHLFTALQDKQRIVPGIDGGMVGLGKSTSRMNKRKFAELIEIIYWFGAERNVKWSEKAEDIIAEYKEWLEVARAKERSKAA